MQLKKVVDDHPPAKKLAQLEVRHLQKVVAQRVVPAQKSERLLAALPQLGPEGSAGGRGEWVLLEFHARVGEAAEPLPGVVLPDVVGLKELPHALEQLT